MTQFINAQASSGWQLLLPDDQRVKPAWASWGRTDATPLSDDFLWPRSRISSGAGQGLFTSNLDGTRPIWEWDSFVNPKSAAMGQQHHSISGVTRDRAGAIVTSATVLLFRT